MANETEADDDSRGRQFARRVVQNGGAALLSLAIVVAMTHWFGVSLI